MEFEEALLRAKDAHAAADKPVDAATNFVATMIAWWLDVTPGATPADLFIGEGDGVPVPSGLNADAGAYWESRANRCFQCSFPISVGHALCPACLREARAQARDWDDDEASQRYPALA